MTWKLKQLVEAAQAIGSIANKDLPVKPAFQLARFVKLNQSALSAYDEKRVALVKKYGEESGEGFRVKAEQLDAFQTELNELLEADVEFEFTPIQIADLKDAELSVAALASLGDLLE